MSQLKWIKNRFSRILRLIPGTYRALECVSAFVEEMNKYANLFGMNNTHFVNPHGLDDKSHYSCAKDLARLAMYCTSDKRLMEYWGQASYSVSVRGPKARTISGSSTYSGTAMMTVEDYYHIIGGKSGTLLDANGRYENLCLVCESKVDHAWLVGCIMYNTYHPSGNPLAARGVAFKELLDWLEEFRKDSSIAEQVVQASYCSAWVMPPPASICCKSANCGELNFEMVGKSSSIHAKPASITKLMTAKVALDFLPMSESITIKSSDIQSGSGDTFYSGDVLYVEDAILAMLLPSSNTLATALARVAGERILRAQKRRLIS